MLASGAWLFATIALLLVGAAAFAAGALWRRQRLQDALAEAVAGTQALAALADARLWRSDREHRLVTPPWAGAAALPAAPGEALAAQFESLEPAPALAAQLDARAAFGPLRVRRLAPAGDKGLWLLHGRPCHDRDGAFAGFIGSARALQDRAALDRALLAAVLSGRDAAQLVAVGGGGGAEDWQLAHANAAACERLGIDAGGGWEAALARLPDGLRAALAGRVPTAAPARHDGWSVQRVVADDVQALWLAEDPVPSDAAEAAAHQASLSYTVAHDLRAPIRVVEGFTRILKEDCGRLLDRVGNEHLDRVLAAAARMNQMIDAVLTLARLSSQPLARQKVDLSQLAGYIVDELRRAAPDRQAEVEIEPGLLAHGDPTLLRVVLENLLGNAWKYTQRAPRARIVLAAEPAAAGQRGWLVRDNGAGFDMRSAERLFGLFQRLHSASEFAGTGVGLASVRRIVQRHGGQIWAEAEPGRGAVFHVTLRD